MQRRVGPEDPTAEVAGEAEDPAHRQLGDVAEPGDLAARLRQRALAEVGVAGDLVHRVELHERLADVRDRRSCRCACGEPAEVLHRHRPAAATRVGEVAELEEVAGATGEVAADRAGQRGDAAAATAGAEPAALEHQRGVGDRPAVVDAADGGVDRHPHVGEEHLVEHGASGELAQRPDLDAGLVHVDREVGDALVLGHVGIGAGEQHAEVGPVAARGPHLLAVDDPLVAVELGAGVEPGEVGAGARLAEQLAPGDACR